MTLSPSREVPKELTAGRELDALVAEKVMGIDPRLIHTHRGGASFQSDLSITGWLDVAPVPHYSTDIAAAWEVVEKCRISVVCSEDGWYAVTPHDIEHGSRGLDNSLFRNVRDDARPLVVLVGDAGQHDQFSTAYDSAPLAICRAALSSRALQEEGEN